MSEKHSDTGIIKARFPAYAWLPRWTRTYLTPQNALAIAVALFSAGVWWDNRERSNDLKDIRKDISATEKAMEHVLTKADIKTMALQVDEVWKWKKGIDAELEIKLKTIAPPSPAAFTPEPPKKRR